MRFLKISWVLSKFIVFYKLTPYRKDNFGKRLRLAAEELGITFIKIGQILSMRYDLLSKEDCEELQLLLDNVRPIPEQKITLILAEEYGDPKKIFSNFEMNPIGSASVSQVHKAVLHDGSIVAVKIKRPNVDHKFLADMMVLKTLARVGSLFFEILRRIQVAKLVDYFESWIKQDLDFIAEAQNMKKIKKQYDFAATTFRSDLGKGIFPKPFEQFCTENVIVMDFVDGIPLSRKKELIANKDYDVEKSVKSYVNAAVRNWFRDDQQTYFYQADPHLSNILALPHGDAASIDYGLISELSQKEATICKDLIIAVYLKDVPQTIKIVAQMVSKDYGECYKLLRPDIENYLEEAARQGFGFWFLGLAKVLIQNDVKFPLFLTTFGRTAVVLDGLVYSYLPNETTVDILGEEFNKQVFNQAIKNIKDINWLKLCFTLSKKIKETPDLINIALEDPLKMISEIAKVIKTTA